QPPPGWQGSTLFLEGGSGLGDFEFVRDSSARDNLVVRNLLNGSSIVIEGQFANETLVGSTLWLDADLDGDGTADWSAVDLDADGEADFAALDADANGAPDWGDADFDGDGLSDWQRFTELALDVDADGIDDVHAYDENADGTVDAFEITLPSTVSQPDISWVAFVDRDGDNVVDAYTTDYSTFTLLPTDPSGAVAWSTIGTNGDG